MDNFQLDPEEQEILASYEAGEWRPVADSKGKKERYQTYAQATFKKDRRINIRISSKDLEKLQTKALEEGLPYQTLISSILHKYVAGSLVENS